MGESGTETWWRGLPLDGLVSYVRGLCEQGSAVRIVAVNGVTYTGRVLHVSQDFVLLRVGGSAQTAIAFPHIVSVYTKPKLPDPVPAPEV